MNFFFYRLIERIVQNESKKFFTLGHKSNKKPLVYTFSTTDLNLLYIHIPFCKVLCPFCSFNRYVYSEEIAEAYFEALMEEVRIYSKLGFRFNNVYFGGGTPTVNIDLLVNFIDELKGMFDIKSISVETTPSEMDLDVIKKLEGLKVDRLSIGVQSFDDLLLKQIGRYNQTRKMAVEKIELAKGHFKTINVDLIFNFPTQTIESFMNDIRIFKNLGIEQVTFYPLMPTPFKEDILIRKYCKINKKREVQFYKVIQEEMLEIYKPSTVWCFSKGDNIIDEYIIENNNYIGVGAGAISFVEGELHVNTFSPQVYIKKIKSHRLPIVFSKKCPKRKNAEYYLLTKSFGMKIDKNELQTKFGFTLFIEVMFLKFIGALVEIDNMFCVTKKGMFYISAMMKNFFTSLNILREYYMKRKI